MVDPWFTEKHVDRKKRWLAESAWFYKRGKRGTFCMDNSDFGACVSVFTACWPNGKNDFDKSVRFVWIIWYGFSVNPPFGQLELYVFGQDWPRAIRPTENSVNKGPTVYNLSHNFHHRIVMLNFRIEWLLCHDIFIRECLLESIS